jgi:hypothetical protein
LFNWSSDAFTPLNIATSFGVPIGVPYAAPFPLTYMISVLSVTHVSTAIYAASSVGIGEVCGIDSLAV